MTTRTVTLLVALGFLCLECVAQSLPEAARSERSRQTEPRRGRTFTNENIPETRGVTIPREAPVAQPVPPPETGPAEVSAPEEDTPDAVPSPADRTEEQWRDLFEEARRERSRSEALVALTEQELADLNHQLLTRSDIFNREQVFPPLIRAKEEELALARSSVEEANQTIARLQTELRRAGRPAGWGRP
jgi:hypothetical protein